VQLLYCQLADYQVLSSFKSYLKYALRIINMSHYINLATLQEFITKHSND